MAATRPDFVPAGRIVLASASAARAALLRGAGIAFAVEAAAIDEAAIKEQARRNGETSLDAAVVLAAARQGPRSRLPLAPAADPAAARRAA